MNNLDWDDLRYFLAAARGGSLSAASRELGSNQPTVGRRIAALEQVLGYPLFQRHSQGLTLTEDGMRILHAAAAMDEVAAGVKRVRDSTQQTLSGTVRVAAPEGLAMTVLARSLADFARMHPELDLEVQGAAASADLARGEADVAIRLYRPTNPDLVIRRLGDMQFGLYASNEYLLQYGTPTTVESLEGHRFITYGEQLQMQDEHRWLASLVPNARWVFRSDATSVRLAAAESGIGIAVLPQAIVSASDQLQRLLPEQQPAGRTVWLVVHRDLRHVARIRAVMEFLIGVFGAEE